MKKHLRFIGAILVMVLLSYGAQAQIQVGTGTTTGQSLPIEPYYGYSYSQQIYLASEINASGTITQLKFQFAGSSLSNSNDWTVYIGHTSKTSFSSTSDWVDVSTLTQVYSATFTNPGASGWITIDITDWAYNGTDNIIVAIDENNSGYNSSSDDFYCTSVSGNRSLENHNDYTNPDPSSPPSGSTRAYIPNIIFDGISQACPIPTAQAVTNITVSGADLGWTDASGSHWDVYVTSSGGAAPTQPSTPTANDVDALGNPYTYSSGSSSTSYDWYVRSDCDQDNVGTSAWFGPNSFTTSCVTIASFPYTQDFENGGAIPACWTNDASDAGGEWEFVTSSSYGASGDHTSGSGYYALLNDYSTQTSESPFNMTTSTFDLSASGKSYQLNYWVWIGADANANPIHIDISNDGGTTWTNDVYVHDLTTTGTWFNNIILLTGYTTNNVIIRYRAISDWGSGTDNSAIDDVTIEEIPSCPAPSAQSVTNITSSGANLGWTDVLGSHWDIYVTTAGGAAPTQGSTPTANDLDATGNPYTYSAGSSSTTYEWYVRSDCNQDNISTSSWYGSNSFTTLQTQAPVQSLPFTEDWESNSLNLGTIWNTDAGSVATIETNTASKKGGVYGLEQYGNLSSSYITPSGLADAKTKAESGGANADWTTWNRVSVDLTSTTNPWLSFYYAMGYKYNDNYNNFWVQVSTDGTTWIDLFATQTNGAAVPYTKKDIDLSSYNGNAQLFIRFFHNGKYIDNNLYLDDISVKEVTCPDPSVQTETNILLNSADLAWTENGGATNWNIKYGIIGFDPSTSGTTVAVTTNPITLGGLTAGTTYDWYVQADCGGGSTSSWIGAHSFTTSDGEAANPTPADGASGIAVSAKTLDWDDVVGVDGYHISVGTTSGGTDIVANAAISGVTNSTYTVASDWSINTTYYWTVTTDYNSGSSVTGLEWTFTSQIGPHSFPLTEDFESGFNYFDNASGNDVDFADETTLIHGGTHSVKNTYTSYNDNILHETGILDLSSTSGALLEFWHIALTEDNYDKCYIQVSTDGGSTYVDLPFGAYQGASTDYTSSHTFFDEGSYGDWGNNTGTNAMWKKETFALNSYNVANVRFRFMLHSDGSTSREGWYIDDIHIYEPACPSPSAQTETTITISGADLGWTDGAGSHWDLYVVPTGDPAPVQGTTPTENDVTANPFTYSSGTINTTYDWYVRSDCDQDNVGTSAWEGPSTFTTADGKALNPTPADNAIGIAISAKTLDWDDVNSATGYHITIGTTTGASDIANNVAITGGVSEYTVAANWDFNEDYYWTVTTDFSSGPVVGDEWSFMTVDGKATNPTPVDGASGILVSAKTLDWDDVAGADGYHISVGTTSGGTDVVNNDAISGAINSTYTATANWNYSTVYYWTITTDYNSGSAVAGDEWTFTTECGTYSSFPYTQDFTSWMPTCWNEVRTPSSTRGWDSNTSGYSGNCARFDSYYNTNGNISDLITPTFDLSSLTTAQLTFEYKNPTGGDFSVFLSTDGGSTYSVTLLSGLTGQSSWIKETVDITSNIGSNVKIKFKGTSNYGSGDAYIYLDDVTVGEIPSCLAPTVQTETNITLNSVDLAWTENGTSTHWNIKYGATGFDPNTAGTTVAATANPYTLGGLTAGITYDWYVQADCGSGSTSTWAGPQSFTASDGKAVNSTPADGASGILISATTLDWDDVVGADGYHISVGTTSGGTDIINNDAISGATNSTYTVPSNWNYSTTYYWTITTDYNSGSTVAGDEWTFTSECGTLSVPWNEDFESMASTGSGVVPGCMLEDGGWATASSSGTYNRSAHSGSNYVYTNYTADDWLYSPKISVTAGTSYDFTFYYVTDGNSGWTTVETKYGTSQTSADMTTAIGTALSGPTNTTYQKYIATFTPSTSGDYYFGIHVVATSSPWYITFDDLGLEESPACPAPTAQTVANITVSGADLGWTDAAGAQWDVYVVATGGAAPTQGTVPDGDDIGNPFTYSGGSLSTTYDWYVRSDCDGDNIGTSTWEGPSTFTTLDGKATNPTPSDNALDIARTATTLDWDDVVGATGYHITVGTTTGANDIVNNVAISGATNSTYTVSSNWDFNEDYYWTVTTDFSSGPAVGNEWSFMTVEGKAVNPTPSDGATGITISSTTLDWNDVSGADGYHISIGTTSGGTEIVNNFAITGVTNSTYTYASNWSYGTTYYWTITTDYTASSGAASVTGTEWDFATELATSAVVSGKTSKCAPIYERLHADGTVESSTKYVFYDSYSFTVPTSGTYNILADWGYDGYLHIYTGSFDPASPLTNWLGGDDDNDNGGGSGASGSKIESVSLSSGTTYIVVGSSYSSYVSGTASYWIEGADVATMPSNTDYNGAPYRTTYTIPSTDGTSRTSDYECDDDNDWTTYYNDAGTANDYSDDYLLLAVKKNGNNLGNTSVTVEGAAGASEIAPSTTFSKYVNSFQGWYVFNRYWKLTPATQPTSDVDVRFYYKDADFNDLKTALTNAGRTPLPTTVTDLSVVKINDLNSSNYDIDPANGHNNIPKASAYNTDGAWIYNAPSGTAPASTKWIDGDYNGADHFFEFTIAHFSGGGGGAAGNTKDGTLPIELLSFNAFANGDINQVVWKTATEFNVEKFIIERMDPATKKIEEIGTVKAVGTSNVIQSYSFDDVKPLEEAYYRIRNVDYDGATESFDWVYVKRGATQFKIVNLYPNPAHNSTTIELVNPIDHNIHLEIRDVVGKLILTKDYESVDGLQKINIDLSAISAGSYYLSIDNSKEHMVKMLIVR